MSSPKRVGGRYWIMVALLGILTGCGLFFLVGGQGDIFADGTYIGQVPVGGLTPAAAEKVLGESTVNTEMTIVVTGPDDYTKKLNIAALGGLPDYKTSVKQAWDSHPGVSWWDRLGWGSAPIQRYPLLISYQDKAVERWLEQLRFDVDRKPTEPRVVWEDEAMRVAEPASGLKLDAAAVRSALPKHYQPGEFLVALKMDEVSAMVESSDLTGLVELSSFATSFNAGNINRTVNLKKAASALNGTVVAPNGVFSFNDTVGPRDLANGYKEAMVIIKNEFTPGIGGGICQVSSTLYNAALLAGFPIVERRNHSVAVSYVPVGLDATVAYPYQDFKFKNDADSAVYINAYARGSQLYVKLFGRRSDSISVKIERIVDQTTPFTVVQKVDQTLGPGVEKVDHEGVQGYKVRTYRVISDKQGQVRERKLLSTDRYAPLNKLVLVSSAVSPANGESTVVTPGEGGQPVSPGNEVTPETGSETAPELPAELPPTEPTEPTSGPGIPIDNEGLPEDAEQM